MIVKQSKYISLEKEFNRLSINGFGFDRPKIESFLIEYAKNVLLWRNAPQEGIKLCLEKVMYDKLKEMVDVAEARREKEGKGVIRKLVIPEYTSIQIFNLVRDEYPENGYNLQKIPYT
jgi:hypothetical protein